MEVDGKAELPQNPENSIEDSNQGQPMEEEPESFDLGDLDIFSLEQACKKKEFDKTQDRQLENLEVVL